MLARMSVALRGQKRTSVSGTGITEKYEPPCGCWELNPEPLQEQPVFLNAEPSLQLPGPRVVYLALFPIYCMVRQTNSIRYVRPLEVSLTQGSQASVRWGLGPAASSLRPTCPGVGTESWVGSRDSTEHFRGTFLGLLLKSRFHPPANFLAPLAAGV